MEAIRHLWTRGYINLEDIKVLIDTLLISKDDTIDTAVNIKLAMGYLLALLRLLRLKTMSSWSRPISPGAGTSKLDSSSLHCASVARGSVTRKRL